MQTWLSSLPDHLRFSQENLDKQIDMFETGSTGGAWCYCFMHALHPCYILELTDVSAIIAPPGGELVLIVARPRVG